MTSSASGVADAPSAQAGRLRYAELICTVGMDRLFHSPPPPRPTGSPSGGVTVNGNGLLEQP